MLILAESELPVTAIQIGVFIGCASFILSIIRNIAGIRADSMRVKQGTAETPLHLAPHQMSEMKEPALKSDMEDELEDIDQQITDLRKHLDTKFDEVLRAGQHRADKITARIDSEISAIRQDIEHRSSLIHEKINGCALHVAGHDEAINNLKATDYRHDQIIQTMQTKLATARKPS